MPDYFCKNYRFKDEKTHTELKELAASENLIITDMLDKLLRFYKITRKIDELQKSKNGADKVEKGD